MQIVPLEPTVRSCLSSMQDILWSTKIRFYYFPACSLGAVKNWRSREHNPYREAHIINNVLIDTVHGPLISAECAWPCRVMNIRKIPAVTRGFYGSMIHNPVCQDCKETNIHGQVSIQRDIFVCKKITQQDKHSPSCGSPWVCPWYDYRP